MTLRPRSVASSIGPQAPFEVERKACLALMRSGDSLEVSTWPIRAGSVVSLVSLLSVVYVVSVAVGVSVVVVVSVVVGISVVSVSSFVVSSALLSVGSTISFVSDVSVFVGSVAGIVSVVVS